MPRSTQEVRVFPYEQAVLKELNPQGYTSLVDMFEAACGKFPERPAFTAIGQTLSFADIDRLSRDFAAYLVGSAGLVPGQRIAIQLPNLNQYPNEIEGVVYTHPDVVECAAVGIPDEKSGEAVKLYVVSSNPALDQDSLRGFCREQLTAYKVPRTVEFRKELPKSNVGKILRRELRD